MAYDRLIMPKLIVSLEASDDFLRERVINLPEIVVVGTHNTDEAFSRRLTDYRAINTDEETVLNYFDELEFHPERIGNLSCFCVCVLCRPVLIQMPRIRVRSGEDQSLLTFFLHFLCLLCSSVIKIITVIKYICHCRHQLVLVDAFHRCAEFRCACCEVDRVVVVEGIARHISAHN